MAHTKSGGSTKLGRDSASKRLGVKKYDGEKTKVGEVLIRQRGTKYHPGMNVGKGKDDTLFALKEGVIKFSAKNKLRFNGRKRKVTVVNVQMQSEVDKLSKLVEPVGATKINREDK